MLGESFEHYRDVLNPDRGINDIESESMTNLSEKKPAGLRLWEWVRNHPYTVVAIVLFVSQAFPAFLRHNTEWTNIYVGASRDLLAGRDFMTKHVHFYVYPPFFTILAIPFTFLPQALSQFLFYAISVACIIYVVKSAWELSGGGRLEGTGAKVPRVEHLVFVLALVCGGHYLLNALAHLQTDLLIAALVMAGCMALRANKTFVSATWFGLATAIKCTPLLFAPYLAWRGKWLAAFWVVVLAIGLNFLPNLVKSPPSGGFWATQWFNLYIAPLDQSKTIPGTWYNAPTDNQSLAGAIRRMTSTSLKWSSHGVKIVYLKNSDRVRTLKLILLLLYLLVTVPSAYALWRRRRTTGAGRDRPLGDALEFSIIMLLMLLLSPDSSRAHFGIMLLPALCLGRIAVSEHSHAAWALLFSATFFSLVTFNNPLNAVLMLFLWIGAPALVAVSLLAGCVLVLLRSPAMNPEPVPE